MKRAITLLFILFFSLAVFGQKNKPCSANLLKAEIRGFSLGMSKDEIIKILPDIKWKTLDNGTESATHFNFAGKKDFETVWYMEFSVFENSLYQIAVTYNESVKINNISTFADDISKSWNITEKWKGAGYVMMLECKERYVAASSAKTLYLTDTTLLEKTKKETKFKP